MSRLTIKQIHIDYQWKKICLEYSSTLQWCDKTILCLHWLGANKSDFKGLQTSWKFMDFNVIVLDFPGHGGSAYAENLSIGDLVEIIRIWLRAIRINTVTIVGHSMGWLIGLLYSKKYSQDVDFFVNVEWNLTQDDCGFSQYVASLSSKEFQEKFWDSPGMQGLSDSMVKISGSGILMNIFKGMSEKSAFVYGSNSKISYLDELGNANIPVIEISESWHHSFMENPDEFYEKVLGYIS